MWSKLYYQNVSFVQTLQGHRGLWAGIHPGSFIPPEYHRYYLCQKPEGRLPHLAHKHLVQQQCERLAVSNKIFKISNGTHSLMMRNISCYQMRHMTVIWTLEFRSNVALHQSAEYNMVVKLKAFGTLSLGGGIRVELSMPVSATVVFTARKPLVGFHWDLHWTSYSESSYEWCLTNYHGSPKTTLFCLLIQLFVVPCKQ